MLGPRSHSSRVRLNLERDGVMHELAQVGPGFVVFRDDVAVPPGAATLHVAVDESLYKRQVALLGEAGSGRRRATSEDG